MLLLFLSSCMSVLPIQSKFEANLELQLCAVGLLF